MTTDTQNHQAIRGLLENALQQVLSTQEQVTAIESQLQEIKSQINLALEAIDPVLKQCEIGDEAEKVRSDMVATLGVMFEHVKRIVNDAREHMLNPPSDEPDALNVAPNTASAVTEAVNEAIREAEKTLAETVPDEPTPAQFLSAESLSEKSPSEESLTAELLTGTQVGQRATESLNEMIATIDETNTEVNTETGASQEPEEEPEMETPDVASQEQETEPTPLPETVASKPVPFEAEMKFPEKETPKCPGSTDSLNELLAKAKAASSEADSPFTDLTPLDDDEEEEDVQTVNELLKTTSGSFATQ